MEPQSEKPGGHQRLEQLIRELRQTNSEMGRLLERLPLSNHEQVTRLTKLVDKQKRLMRTSAGTAPAAVAVFLDNEKHAARYLQMRYEDAMKRGRLRKSK
jgi:hypothetical protein